MRVVVSSDSADLSVPVSANFGRCATYLFVDVDTLEFQALANPAANSGGGAGIQAAQLVIEHGAQAVLTGNVGPNAFQVFDAAGVPVFLVSQMTIGEAVEAYKSGRLEPAPGATVSAHAGPRLAPSRAVGATPSGSVQIETARGAPPATAGARRRDEVAELERTAVDLRRQLADVMDRISKLEEEK